MQALKPVSKISYTTSPMRIHMKDIELELLIGAFESERQKKQRIVLNFKYELDGSNAASTDKLIETVDYVDVVAEIRTKSADTEFYLLETFAAFALEIIMQDSRVIWAEVEVDKPNAPIPDIASVSVALSARRN